jgi:ATP-dependent 26S proteasome regulatory subunit
MSTSWRWSERCRVEARTPFLFQLLNDMDGLAEDADVVFVLTTNRVELLEPALAARPGRIDQAVEIKLPDADSRRRLLELYSRGLDLDVTDLDDVVDRSEGVSAAFIKELARRAALLAADAQTRWYQRTTSANTARRSCVPRSVPTPTPRTAVPSTLA